MHSYCIAHWKMSTTLTLKESFKKTLNNLMVKSMLQATKLPYCNFGSNGKKYKTYLKA